MKKPTLIVITGPTASGKSALAVSLAESLQTEIISADSRQIYKGIPISTAVPTEEEKRGIRHHLLEILPLDAYYSAAKFAEETYDLTTSLFKNKETVIICGGSMLYLDSLLYGIDELPTVPPAIRESQMKLWKTNGDVWLLDRLKELDPLFYHKVDKNNLKRVFHAVEVSITANAPYSSLLTKGNKEKIKELPFKVIKFCLTGEREILFRKINDRVLNMIKNGLEKEAQKVYPLKHLNSLNTVGLKEMFQMIEGKLGREEAIARIQKNTRVYAKKQLTWHKRDQNLVYLDFDDTMNHNINKILELIQKS